MVKIGTNDTPATNALIMISAWEGINIITIFGLAIHFLKITFEKRDDIILFASVLGLSVMLINYFILYKNLAIICKKYENDTKKKNLTGTILLLIYLFGSFLVGYLISTFFM